MAADAGTESFERKSRTGKKHNRFSKRKTRKYSRSSKHHSNVDEEVADPGRPTKNLHTIAVGQQAQTKTKNILA